MEKRKRKPRDTDSKFWDWISGFAFAIVVFVLLNLVIFPMLTPKDHPADPETYSPMSAKPVEYTGDSIRYEVAPDCFLISVEEEIEILDAGIKWQLVKEENSLDNPVYWYQVCGVWPHFTFRAKLASHP